MTLNGILTEADRGRHAKADYGLETAFRNRLWPRFLDDVDVACGNAAWRTRTDGQVTIPQGGHSAVLPIEVGRINRLWLSGPLPGTYMPAAVQAAADNLTCINEDTQRIAAAVERLSRAQGGISGVYPGAWWVELLPPRETPEDTPPAPGAQNSGWILYLDYPAPQELTIRFVYQIGPALEDVSAFPLDYNMDRLIPMSYQYALIALVRSDLLADRYSDGDPRAQQESSVYAQFLNRLQKRPNPTPASETRVTFR